MPHRIDVEVQITKDTWASRLTWGIPWGRCLRALRSEPTPGHGFDCRQVRDGSLRGYHNSGHGRWSRTSFRPELDRVSL